MTQNIWDKLYINYTLPGSAIVASACLASDLMGKKEKPE